MLVGFPLIQFWSVAMYHRNFTTLKGEQAFTLTPAHLSMKGPLHNTDLDWGAVRRVVETPSFLLFYISKATAYFLPKGAISQEDLPRVREQLSQWLPGRVVLQTTPAPVAAV
jgi:YcxB-like protein